MSAHIIAAITCFQSTNECARVPRQISVMQKLTFLLNAAHSHTFSYRASNSHVLCQPHYLTRGARRCCGDRSLALAVYFLGSRRSRKRCGQISSAQPKKYEVQNSRAPANSGGSADSRAFGKCGEICRRLPMEDDIVCIYSVADYPT